jgi:hypothetical protein
MKGFRLAAGSHFLEATRFEKDFSFFRAQASVLGPPSFDT